MTLVSSPSRGSSQPTACSSSNLGSYPGLLLPRPLLSSTTVSKKALAASYHRASSGVNEAVILGTTPKPQTDW